MSVDLESETGTVISAPSKAARRAGMRAGLYSAGALLAAVTLFHLLYRPQRTGPALIGGTIHSRAVEADGTLFWLINEPGGASINGLSLRDGRLFVLAREQIRNRAYSPLVRVGDFLYYRSWPGRVEEPMIGVMPGRSTPIPGFAGRFLYVASSRLRPGERDRWSQPESRRSSPFGAVHRVRIHGGNAPEVVPASTGAWRGEVSWSAFTERGIYWIPARPYRTRTVFRRGEQRLEVPADRELWYSDYAGGAPRAAAQGICADDRPVRAGKLILWRTPRAYPDRSVDLYLLNTETGEQSVIPQYEGDGMPIAHGDSIVWLESGAVAGESILCRAYPLRGQTVQRIVLNPRDLNPPWFGPLRSHRDRLYVFAERPASQSADGRVIHEIARVEPEARSPLAAVRRLPGTFSLVSESWLSGSHLYFLYRQERTHPVDWLFASSTSRLTTMVQRVPVP